MRRFFSCFCCNGRWWKFPATYPSGGSRSSRSESARANRNWSLNGKNRMKIPLFPSNWQILRFLLLYNTRTSAERFLADPSFIRSATPRRLANQRISVKTFVGHNGIVAGRTENGFAKIRIARYGALHSCQMYKQVISVRSCSSTLMGGWTWKPEVCRS